MTLLDQVTCKSETAVIVHDITHVLYVCAKF